MVLPTKELLSTLTPFTVLRSEDSNEEGSSGSDEDEKSSSSNSPSSTGTLRMEDKMLLMIKNESTASASSSSPAILDGISSTSVYPVTGSGPVVVIGRNGNGGSSGCGLVVRTTTLGEARLTQDDIDRKRGTGFGYGNNNEVKDNDDDCDQVIGDGDRVGGSGSSKILNLLNARNASFLSTSTSSSSKFSEDELFSQLKSRFIEKHFRSILRSQQGHNKLDKDKSSGGGIWTLTKNLSLGNNINESVKSDAVLNNAQNGSVNNIYTDGYSNVLHNNKPLKIITVELPEREPQLDIPRLSYTKSAKEKFFKMHEQAKSHALDRYRKLCASLRTTVWPQLHPVQVGVEVVLSNLFMLIVAPFVLISVILLCILRFCIGIVLKIRYKDRFKLLSGSDAAWAYQSYANDSSFLSLYVIQGDCNISRIRERVLKNVISCQDPQSCKLTYSRLLCKIVQKFGFYCWETLHPRDFCINDHIAYITNDPSAVLTEEQVLREIQRFMDQPLPEDQPQWQILVVPKFLYSKEHDYFTKNEDILEDDGFGNFDTITVKKKPGNKSTFYTGNQYYALIWRINHALMDGLSAANCLQHCIADMPVKLSVDPLQKLNVSIGMKIGMYLKMMIFGSRSLLRSMLHRDLNCFHGPGLTGPKNLGWSRGISLETIKKIRKNNDGATTTAVMASVVGGSLSGLAIRKNYPVPKEIRAGITCAILPYPNIRPQNRFTVAHLKLKLDSHKERLNYATKSMKELVRSADVIKNYGLISMIGLAPKIAIPWFMNNCEATVLISNIPGPMEQYTIFQGQKLVDIIAWNTIKGNTAIGVCLFSYAGRVRAGVIGDGTVLPSTSDVPSLIEELERDLVNLASDSDIKEKDVFMDILT